jgi:hypothetical protein
MRLLSPIAHHRHGNLGCASKLMWHLLPEGVVSLLLAVPRRDVFPLLFLLGRIERDGVPLASHLLNLLGEHLLISLDFIYQLNVFLQLLQKTGFQLFGPVGFGPGPPCQGGRLLDACWGRPTSGELLFQHIIFLEHSRVWTHTIETDSQDRAIAMITLVHALHKRERGQACAVSTLGAGSLDHLILFNRF